MSPPPFTDLLGPKIKNSFSYLSFLHIHHLFHQQWAKCNPTQIISYPSIIALLQQAVIILFFLYFYWLRISLSLSLYYSTIFSIVCSSHSTEISFRSGNQSIVLHAASPSSSGCNSEFFAKMTSFHRVGSCLSLCVISITPCFSPLQLTFLQLLNSCQSCSYLGDFVFAVPAVEMRLFTPFRCLVGYHLLRKPLWHSFCCSLHSTFGFIL